MALFKRQFTAFSLNKSLYGLKQTPRAWYNRFAMFLLSIGFTEAKSDTSLFVYRHGSDTVYLLLYVDDIVLTASSSNILRWTITSLQKEFSMKDLGPLNHFLGINVTPHSGGLLLTQRQYCLEILERAGMSDNLVLRLSTLWPSSPLKEVRLSLIQRISVVSLVLCNI